MSEERLSQVERTAIELRHKDSVHDELLKQLVGSHNEIRSELKRTNDILQQQVLNDERVNARIDKMEANIMAKIQASNESIKRAHSRIDKIESIFSRLAWTVITMVILGVMGAVIKFGA
ncbi:MAG: hypothetical protein IE928_08645 [Gammaproteobacteria bacterium]|nr:hypothetical protein [Gammaproteobacteria bacterium]